MSAHRKVTELDFRMPEYRHEDPKDYEFRDSDKKLVRKDRFKMGMSSIAGTLGSYDYEIDNVKRMIDVLVNQYPDRICEDCNELAVNCICETEE